MPSPIRIAVVGAGAFGRNHLRVLQALEQASSPLTPRPSQLNTSKLTAQHQPAPAQTQLAAAVDPIPQTRAEVTARYNIPTFATVDDLLAADLNLHAATVAVPTLHHAQIATQLLQANLDVLVEKPLTATLPEAEALITLAAARNRILAAGHLERFNPAVTAALAALTRPMFFEAHRLSVFTPRSLDVDVVLDLMIHDLDILLTMARSPITEIRAVGLAVLSPKTDIANVRLEFASGAVANLTASRVSTEQVRKLRLFQPAQYLSLDYARQELLKINIATPTTLSSRPEAPSAGVERPAFAPAQPPGNPHPSPGLTFEKLAPPRTEPLRLELEDFLEAVNTRRAPRVPAQAAREALALALAINTAIAAHANRTGLTNHEPILIPNP